VTAIDVGTATVTVALAVPFFPCQVAVIDVTETSLRHETGLSCAERHARSTPRCAFRYVRRRAVGVNAQRRQLLLLSACDRKFEGVTETELRVAAVTVRVALAEMDPEVTVMVVEPMFAAVNRLPTLVATDELLAAQTGAVSAGVDIPSE